MSVILESDGPVRTILINRPAVRNAVDRQTAEALANEFQHGRKTIQQEAFNGATRFSDGAGRHGAV